MSIWSNVTGALDDAKSQVNAMVRKYRFWKKNRSRQEEADLQYSLMKCWGKMETCRNGFNRTIKQQSRAIAEGRREGMDTLVNEQNLWDAALGYLMVKDAIYALKTVTTYDSITHAYEMLDATTRQISGNGIKLPKFMDGRFDGKRNDYGYLTSKAALEQKEELLDSIFEELKNTGDIEACLSKRPNPGKVDAERRGQYTGTVPVSTSAETTGRDDDLDELSARLGSAQDSSSTLGDDLDVLDSAAMSIDPPDIGR
ncbi:MAG: hypothetical protein LUH16_06600 [Clostridiales bacterium]|nr:hypothetical protein [Clostridiales bacterium]